MSLPVLAGTEIKFSDFKVKKLSDGQFKFVEGPAWDGKDRVYFSDIPENRIYSYSLSKNLFALEFDNTEGTNGLLFLPKTQSLLMCQQKTGRISRLDPSTKKVTPIIEKFSGTRFNRPNDLVMDRQGGIYFTDPSWSDDRPQAIKGIYYLTKNGTLTRVVEDMDKPNGVVLSPDEKFLYAVDSTNFIVRRYRITKPGTLAKMKSFASLKTDNANQASNADGIAVDAHGRLYVSYRHGVSVFDNKGRHLGTIEVPEGPSNLEFAGKEMNVLFITAHNNLYQVELPVKGLRFPQ